MLINGPSLSKKEDLQVQTAAMGQTQIVHRDSGFTDKKSLPLKIECGASQGCVETITVLYFTILDLLFIQTIHLRFPISKIFKRP